MDEKFGRKGLQPSTWIIVASAAGRALPREGLSKDVPCPSDNKAFGVVQLATYIEQLLT